MSTDDTIKNNYLFNKKNIQNTIYASQFKKIDISKVFNYNNDISIDIDMNGDFLHRCFLEIEIPNLKFYDTIINNQYYKTFKINKLSNIQNDIDYWLEEYNNFYNYANIQIIVYLNIKKLFDLKNITLEYLQSIVNSTINDYSNKISEYKLLIDANIISHIDITTYINNLDILNIANIKTDVDKKYTNILNYLEYYHSNKVYYESKYSKTKNGEIFYKWVDNLSHHYFNYFELNIDSIVMDSYSNDLLNIYQKHNIENDLKDSYNKLIGNSNDIYKNNNLQKHIYTPLLFWFCKDISLSLPLICLKNSKIKLNFKTNKINNLIYFQDWEQYYNDIITLEIPRKDHNINDNTNSVEIYDLDYNSVDIKLPENIYIYKCKRIDKKVLDIKFPGINSDKILTNYGSEDSTGKFLSLENFTFLMNNLKKDTKLSTNTKILIGDYHYFIDYNYLLNLIDKPKVKLLAEYCYIKDYEKKIILNNNINYVVETHGEILININNELNNNDSISELNGLIKNIYYYSQLKTNLEGDSKYGKANLDNYTNKFINNIEINLNNFNLIENNNFSEYYLLKSQLPDGVNFLTFSLNPDNIEPSGALNLTKITGKSVNIDFKETYINHFSSSNINNPNNLGSLFKIIYTKYNKFIVRNGKGSLNFY